MYYGARTDKGEDFYMPILPNLYWVMTTVLFTVFFHVSAEAASKWVPCREDRSRSESRSKELREIAKDDQEDRQDWEKKSPDQIFKIAKRDEKRRKEVAEIFAEGCLVKAEDFAAAALVFQHGDTAEHFFQAYAWAKRAVELGDAKQKSLIATAVDRYLINSGRKQLFATQASRRESDSCWCLEPTEPGFPDSVRKDYGGRPLSGSFDWLKGLNAGKNCPIQECSTVLKPSPRGTVPGLW
jgi:hypothetical protein